MMKKKTKIKKQSTKKTHPLKKPTKKAPAVKRKIAGKKNKTTSSKNSANKKKSRPKVKNLLSTKKTEIKQEDKKVDIVQNLHVAKVLEKKPRKRRMTANKATIVADSLSTFDLFDSISDLDLPNSFKDAVGSTSSKIKNKIVRKKPGTKSINYFDNFTQQAIVDYQKETSVADKNLIYLEKIFPAFDALVENLINVYGFTVAYESRSDLKNECLEFLYTALPKFNAEKGSKAFSYFNVVAKHWLTIKSKQNAKKTQSYISLDNKDAIGVHDMETIESFSVAPDGEEIMIYLENKDSVKELLQEVTDKAKTENEKVCVKAINVLMASIDDIDLLNKRAILLYLREITGLSSKQLSIVLANLKKYYKDIKKKEEYC